MCLNVRTNRKKCTQIHTRFTVSYDLIIAQNAIVIEVTSAELPIAVKFEFHFFLHFKQTIICLSQNKNMHDTMANRICRHILYIREGFLYTSHCIIHINAYE